MYDALTHVDRGGSDILCHIRTQQTCSTEKDEDINWVRTNLQTGKNHSAERGDTLHGSYTVIPRLAAWKLYGIRAEFVGFCKVSCDMYRKVHLKLVRMHGTSQTDPL